MKNHLIILILLSIIALWPFFKKGYFESHDGEWMVIRFSAFHQTLSAGQFPVRFVDRLNNNYGYPVLNFLYPLPFYFAEIPKALGFGFVDSVKIIFVFSTVSSVVTMYWALSQVFDKRAGFAGAALYLFVPYRFLDLYVRGSLGEGVAFMFVPLILGSIFKIKKGQKIFLPILAFATAGLILSHNVTAAVFIPFFVFFSYLVTKKLRMFLSAYVLGIAMSSFFIIPALHDLRYVKLSQIRISELQDHLVSLHKLIIPSWGYGPNPNSPDGLSPQLGIVTVGIFAITLFLVVTRKIKDRLIIYCLLAVVLSAVLMTKTSLPVWQAIPSADIIQFPWRLLSAVVFIAAFLAAYQVNISEKKSLLAVLVVIAAFVSTILYTKQAVFVARGDSFYSTNEDTTTVRDEYLPLWVKEKKQNRAYKKIEIIGDGQIIRENIQASKYQAIISAKENIQVVVNTIYFPGHQVKAYGLEAPIKYDNQYGLITFQLPEGNRTVIISYGRSPIHLISEAISLAALFTGGGYFYYLWRKQNS